MVIKDINPVYAAPLAVWQEYGLNEDSVLLKHIVIYGLFVCVVVHIA